MSATGTEGQPPNDSAQHHAAHNGRLPPAWYRRVDGLIFVVESAIVTVATSLMVLFIFFNILYEFTHGQYLKFEQLAERGALGAIDTWAFFWVEHDSVFRTPWPSDDPVVFDSVHTTFHFGVLSPAVFFAVGTFLLFMGGVKASPKWGGKGFGHRLGLAACGTLIFFAFIALMLKTHPMWTCIVTGLAAGAYGAAYLFGQHKAGKGTVGGWLLLGGLLISFLYFSTTVQERFSSWTHSYALFLLLWCAFIGASMATSRGKHLRIDAARKAVPRPALPMYNALSFVVAAAFTGALCVLSTMYFFRRLGGQGTEGEIPDWLKVLAIPVALLLVTLRFTLRALWSARGYIEPMGGEVVLPPAGEEATT